MKNNFSIVIVNWNSGSQLKNCLESIEKAKKNNFHLRKIIVVDNASADNSLDGVEKINLPIEIIRNPENYGFAKACNIGAKRAEGDFILFLNPDMVVFEDTFERLFNYIYEHDRSDIGIYGIQLLDEKGRIQRTCARFPGLWNLIIRTIGLDIINPKIFKSYRMNDWDHKNTKEVNHVIGAFFLVKVNLFRGLNGFDENFFVYLEDLDFSKRAHKLGYRTIYITEAKAYHRGGGTSEKVKGKRLFYDCRSRIIYGFKHLGTLKGLILMLTVFTIEPIARTMFLLSKFKLNEIKEIWNGFFELYKNCFDITKLGMRK